MESSQNTNSFKAYFNNPQYSDIIIYAGEGNEEEIPNSYHLHQIIVCNSSEHLKITCSSAPTDAAGRKILTVYTTAPAFELVFRWMYGERDLTMCKDVLVLSDALGYVYETFNASEMEDLRLALLEHLIRAKLEQKCCGAPTDPQAQWKVLSDACVYADPGDYKFVAGILKAQIPEIQASPSWLGELASESDKGVLAAGLIYKAQL
ncbi:hypothetical protein TWF481_003188 [Arthrobotrys musiformis]|uniref:BTB domain-containing protein n=1 Tax=Arthrobotrys musiformis TaxID=47236 RepID=A0AAV9VVV2_9PEZI